jgi:hypothetical protein
MRHEHSNLRRTRVSLFYLITYLFQLAAGLLISPSDTFHLLGSRAEHATHRSSRRSNLPQRTHRSYLSLCLPHDRRKGNAVCDFPTEPPFCPLDSTLITPLRGETTDARCPGAKIL